MPRTARVGGGPGRMGGAPRPWWPGTTGTTTTEGARTPRHARVATAADVRVMGRGCRQKQGSGLHPGAWEHAMHVESGGDIPKKKMGALPGPANARNGVRPGAQGPVMSVGHVWGVYSPPELALDPLHPLLSTPRSRCALFVAVFVHPGVPPGVRRAFPGAQRAARAAQSVGGGVRVAAATMVAV